MLIQYGTGKEARLRIVRFVGAGRVKYGVFEGETVRCLRGSPFNRWR
ncbi:DUF2437 domain-containing protein, partial [Chloroflexota bacterium]